MRAGWTLAAAVVLGLAVALAAGAQFSPRAYLPLVWGGAVPPATPSPLPEPTATLTHTPTHAPTATPSPRPGFTASPTHTPTHAPTVTATPSPSQTWTPSPSPTATGTPSDDPALEMELGELINAERAARGLPPLHWVPELTQAARGHSHDMADHDFVDHEGSDGSWPDERMRRAGYEPLAWGEVVAAGSEEPEAVLQGWLDSPPHREVLLSTVLEDFGIGYARDPASTYVHYWTVDLGARAPGR